MWSTVRGPESKSDLAMARRMTLIVMTDFVCWVPIIFLGFASLGGANAPNDVSRLTKIAMMNRAPTGQNRNYSKPRCDGRQLVEITKDK